MGTPNPTDIAPSADLPPPRPAPAAAGPEPFVVTTPTTTLTLDEQRRGQITVSITNVAGRPLRARLRIDPDPPAAAPWFAVTATAEREFGLGATEAFAVAVAVPAEVAPGRYQVRLDAVAEDHPDETFTMGPTVAVTVPATRRRRSRRPWLVAAAVAAVVVLGGVIAAVVAAGGDRVAVPGVTGQAATAAIDTVTNAGLKAAPDDFVVNPCDPPVVSQDPAPGETADEGATVTLTIGTCRNIVEVPDVVGVSSGEADELTANFVQLEVARVGTTFECGPDILAQKPSAGAQVDRNTVVVIALPRSPSSCPPDAEVETQADPFDVFPQFATS